MNVRMLPDPSAVDCLATMGGTLAESIIVPCRANIVKVD
jgi:hypothetical protein